MMGLLATKPVFGVSNKAKLTPVSSLKNKISAATSLDMILSKKQITWALISLCGCTGWSAPLLFANSEDSYYGVEAQIIVWIDDLMYYSKIENLNTEQFLCNTTWTNTDLDMTQLCCGTNIFVPLNFTKEF